MEKWLKSRIAMIKQNYVRKRRRELVHESKPLIRLIKEEPSAALISVRSIDPHRVLDEHGKTLLHIAVEQGNFAITCHSLNKYLDVNAQDDDGQTPLMLAVKNKDSRLIPILINSEADIYICDNNGKSALQVVSDMSVTDSQIIVQFLNKVKLDCCNDSAKIALLLVNAGCPLRHAIYLHDPEIVRIMLERGCPVGARDPETGQTALHVAFEYASSENIKLLLEHGADIDAMDRKKRLPYFSCGMWGESDKDLEITGMILRRSALLTTSDECGIIQIGNLLKNGKQGAILIILRSDVDLGSKDTHGRTLLHYLALNPTLADQEHLKEELRGKAFDPNACDANGNSVLINATMLGNLMLMELLLDLGADPNTANDQNLSPLLVAICPPPHVQKRSCEPQKCVELLLLYGADLEVVLRGLDAMLVTYVMLNENFAIDLWKRTLSPPIVGQLAILQAKGTPIAIDSIVNAIATDEDLKGRFYVCRLKLENLKTVRVYESVTLYQLVTESIERISIYARNEEFRHNVRAFNDNFCSNAFYSNFASKNVQRAVRIMEARREIADALCDVTGWSYHANPIVVDKIISYAMA